MGYMRHHAVIVTSMHDELLDEARSKAIEFFEEKDMVQLVSPIVFGVMNGYRSFLVAPDGSKEHWEHSDRAEQARIAFVGWLAKQRYNDGSSPIEWVEVQFADDYARPKILRADDEELYEEVLPQDPGWWTKEHEQAAREGAGEI